MSSASPATAAQRQARQRWLVLGLAATVVAAYFAPPAEDGGVVLSERTRRSDATLAVTRPAVPVQSVATPSGSAIASASARLTPVATVLAVQPREAFDGDDGLFKGRPLVAVAAPAQPLSSAAAVASAPAEEPVPRLNLKLIGRYVDNGATAAFVQLQDQNLVVRVGELLSTHYRVEQIDEVSLTLRHLPSEQLQTFRLDSPQ